jgi:hypothetical protein
MDSKVKVISINFIRPFKKDATLALYWSSNEFFTAV